MDPEGIVFVAGIALIVALMVFGAWAAVNSPD